MYIEYAKCESLPLNLIQHFLNFAMTSEAYSLETTIHFHFFHEFYFTFT